MVEIRRALSPFFSFMARYSRGSRGDFMMGGKVSYSGQGGIRSTDIWEGGGLGIGTFEGKRVTGLEFFRNVAGFWKN